MVPLRERAESAQGSRLNLTWLVVSTSKGSPFKQRGLIAPLAGPARQTRLRLRRFTCIKDAGLCCVPQTRESMDAKNECA